MPIVQITGRGLATIACAVALLWGCFIAERITARQAFAERARIMRDLHLLQKKQQQPVSVPFPHYGHPVRSTAG
jgi:hypothetical protein